MAIFDIDNNIDNIDSSIMKHNMGQQIKLINGGRKSGTKLIFNPLSEYDGYNPLVINKIDPQLSYTYQTFTPNNIEVLNYIINLFETTIPSERNFVDENWDPWLDSFDTDAYCIQDPFFDQRIIDLGCGLTYNSCYIETFHIDPIQKLKNSEYISFDNGICDGWFTIHFTPQYKLPVLEIQWGMAHYIENDSDHFTITGEVEVATFYQILKIYKQVIDSL